MTNWMGDDALLRRLEVRLRKPNYHGDIVRIGGTMTEVDTAAATVEMAIEGHNQFDELVVSGGTTAELGYASSHAEPVR